MTHWGWYWKLKNKQHIPRTLCSKLVSIDSFKIMKDNRNIGFTVKPLEVKAIIKDDQLHIAYRKRKEISYAIAIDKLPCNYGGFRYFFRCPLCQKRMRLLYFAEQSIFLCRKCLNLGYISQRLRPTKRYDYMSDRVKETIKSKDGDPDRYQKPRHMHNDTYQKLINKQSYYKSNSLQALNDDLRCWYGAKVEPYLEHSF